MTWKLGITVTVASLGATRRYETDGIKSFKKLTLKAEMEVEEHSVHHVVVFDHNQTLGL